VIEFLALAQADFGDWIETIIVLVVVLGGAFQGIGKAIIKKITVEKEEDASKRGAVPPPGHAAQQRQRGGRSPQRGQAQRGQAPPARPVARPVRTATSGQRQPSQMQAPRPVAPSALGTPTSAPQPTAARPAAGVPVAKPMAPPKEARRSKQPGSTRLGGRKSRSKAGVQSGRAAPSEPQHEALFDHHLKLSDEVAHPSTAATHVAQTQGRVLLPRLTRSALRDAIILREVLGPPVALRGSGDDQ